MRLGIIAGLLSALVMVLWMIWPKRAGINIG
jgi:hypothetical protein